MRLKNNTSEALGKSGMVMPDFMLIVVCVRGW